MMPMFVRREGAFTAPGPMRARARFATSGLALVARAGIPAPAGVLALLVATAMLAGCSETSLNEAPIVDLSAQSRSAVVKPPPMAIPAAPGETLYTVKKGDTLFHLAVNSGATMQDLARWNGIDEHAPIFVGQQLRLQAPIAAADAAGDAASAPAAGMDADAGATAEAVATPIPVGGGGVETRALDAPTTVAPPLAAASMPGAAGANIAAPPSAAVTTPAGMAAVPAPMPAAPPAPMPSTPVPAAAVPAEGATPGPAAAGWIWPTTGPVTAQFDGTRKGIEIAAPEDAPVVAVADGTVSYVGSPRDYGNLIILKHGDDLLSVYAHNKTLLVKEGQSVRRGQTIATAGKTPGIAATLHFEVRRNHVPVDPLGVLPLR